MKNEIIASETFSHTGKHYFFDFKQAANDSRYISMTCSQVRGEGQFLRSTVLVFEEDFPVFIESLSALFGQVGRLSGAPKMVPPGEAARGIKSWDPAARPRERLLAEGRDALSDAELLAILIGSGQPGVTAVDLAAQILRSIGDDLQRLSELTAEELMRFKGMGGAKAMSLLAAFELSVRLMAAVPPRARLKALLAS